MALTRNRKYEILVRVDDRWTILTDAPTKLSAIKEAKQLLATNKYAAVKVNEERGQSRENIVFEEEGTRRAEKAVTIVPQREAPRCEELEDFYRYPARKTMGRLFRQYLDEVGITPFELLHHNQRMKTLLRNDALCLQAMHNISSIQTKGTDEKPHDRLNFLEAMAHQMSGRVQFMENMDGYKELLATQGIDTLIEKVEDDLSPENRDLYVRAAVAAHLAGAADWEGKLVLLLDLAGKKPTTQSIALVDEVIAEILDSASALQEILGYQKNLAKATQILIRVSVGTHRIREGSATPLERISSLLAGFGLPLTQSILQNRVARALGGVSPLTKGDRLEQQEAFKEIVADLASNKLLVDSGLLAEAATLRAKSVLTEEFADESSEKAIDDVIGLLPTQATRFTYLIDLCGTEFGAKNQEHLIGCLARIVDRLQSITQMVEAGGSDAHIVRAAAAIRDRLLSTSLPDQWRLHFARKIYELLLNYSQPETRGEQAVEMPLPPVQPSDEPKAVGAGTEKPREKGGASKKPKKKPTKKLSAQPLERKVIPAGEYIFHEGEDGSEAFLLLSGEVLILRRLQKEEVLIARAGPGSIIGEMALIDSKPRMASVKTVCDTEVTVIPMGEMQLRLDRLEKFDPIMRRLVGMFVQRMRDYKVVGIES